MIEFNSTNWLGLFLREVLTMIFLSWLLSVGINYESELLIDTTGYFIMLVSLIGIAWTAYEIWILMKFRNADSKRRISIDNAIIKIKTDDTEEILETKDLYKVIYSKGYNNWRSSTTHLSYSELIFKNKKRLIITSFTLAPTKLKELLRGVRYAEVNREKKIFEAIKNNNH
ncbi:hypothetical protein [Ekhidna lutea]|nr:hypothetical protein [Ekhidna lutea]